MNEKIKTQKVENETSQEENLVDFFTLLLEIDRRVDSEKYIQSHD